MKRASTSRKTISVSTTIIEFNKILRVSTCTPDIRRGIMNAMEHILHSTDNYCGFRYLTTPEVPVDQLPGINIDENGDFYPDSQYKRFENTDETRRVYALPWPV
jgi:hypothetical protein